jgi:thermitase
MKKKSFFLLLVMIVFMMTMGFSRFRNERSRNPRYRSEPKKIHLRYDNFQSRAKEKAYVSGQILVKFKSNLSEQTAEAAIAAYQSRKIRRIPVIDIYQLEIPDYLSVDEMVSVVSQNPDVEFAEPNYIAHIAVSPNDPFFRYQYALYNSGQAIGIPGSPQGKARADIKATAAWEETTGDEEVIVAVIDSGIDFDHPDLKNKIFSDGRDFVNDDFKAVDDHGHGTFVAGIVAAETNNNEGIAGVAWNCKILPIKVVKVIDPETEYAEYSWVIAAIRYAADNGADVINLSIGAEWPSKGLKEALKYAFRKNIVIAAAAGNASSSVFYPAAYDAYCLAVGATDYNDEWQDWSNTGSEVDVAAPGVRIASCVPVWYWEEGEFPYGFGDGTSYSVAYVSGLAALLKSIKPWLGAADIANIIRYSADDVNAEDFPEKDERIGYGRLNMEKALVPIKISHD